MIALLAAVTTALVVNTAYAFYLTVVIRSQQRGFERERNTLVGVIREQANQLLHLVDRPWTPPPAFVPDTIPEDEDAFLLTDPSQLPEV